ncbi:MAG: DUF3999 domain-containing protein [Syntrophobacteraceae bacterium]
MKLASAFLAMFIMFITSLAAAKEPAPSDFAFGMTLRTKGGAALNEITVPIEVYRGAVHPDHGDVCVFNGAGEPVPYALMQPTTQQAPERTFVPIRLFPIAGAPEGDAGELSLQVRKDYNGAIIDVKSRDSMESKQQVTAYLLDATALDKGVKALRLDWPQTESFIGKVSIQRSDDLDHWVPSVESATIANLTYGEHALTQQTIAIPSVKAKYFRITWQENRNFPTLTSAAVEMADESPDNARRQWATLEPSTRGATPLEYQFDAGGFMPIECVRVKPTERNTLAKALIFSRMSEKEQWTARGAGFVYSLDMMGERLESPDITFFPRPDRFWMVRLPEGGAGLGKGAPQLEVGWTPQRLVFMARGDGPFLLAYGSSKVESSPRYNDLIEQLTKQRERASLIQPAEVDPQFILGGETLRQPIVEYNWKQWVLWCVLVLATALLGWMAFRLYRQIAAAKDSYEEMD